MHYRLATAATTVHAINTLDGDENPNVDHDHQSYELINAYVSTMHV
jgi:hypothetical protein